jgi:hypothetical protein
MTGVQITHTKLFYRWFPVMSPNEDKLADLEICLNLETVSGMYVLRQGALPLPTKL